MHGYLIISPPEGVTRHCFHPVCLCVCVRVCVSGQYFGLLEDIDLKYIHDIYRVEFTNKIDLYRSRVKVTGTVHCFLKVHSYHTKTEP